MNNTNKNPLSYENGFSFGGATRNRTGDKGFADLCLTAWLWRHSDGWSSVKMTGHQRYINRIPVGIPVSENKWARVFRAHFFWSGLRGSNPPPRPWQGRALPNELNPQMVVPPVGIEPTTRGFSVPCSTN